jgi:short-subunit dehydrogenase
MEAFAGQVAFITGASSGIGAALTRELARQGADVALCARRTDRLETLAWEVESTGRRAVPITGDVTQDGSIEKAAASARQALGKIDIVVANAGFGVSGRFEKLTLDDFRRQFETNVFGVLRTVYATLDDLKRSRGRLVLIGSVAGHLSAPSTSPYSMSKFAVHALAEALGYELKAAGVSVTLVSPGFVESEIRRIDNQGEFHQDAKDEAPAWLVMPAEQAAKQIASAIAQREREVVITFHGKAAVFVQRHMPWLLAAGLGRVRR